MNWHKFFKPSKSKIIGSFVILVIAVVILIYGVWFGIAALGVSFGEFLPFQLRLFDKVMLTLLIILFWPILIAIVPLDALGFLAIIPSLLIYPLILCWWYTLACLIIAGIDRFRADRRHQH